MKQAFDAFSIIMAFLLPFQLLCIRVGPSTFKEARRSSPDKELSLQFVTPKCSFILSNITT